jgi:hypothetical protein
VPVTGSFDGSIIAWEISREVRRDEQTNKQTPNGWTNRTEARRGPAAASLFVCVLLFGAAAPTGQGYLSHVPQALMLEAWVLLVLPVSATSTGEHNEVLCLCYHPTKNRVFVGGNDR